MRTGEKRNREQVDADLASGEEIAAEKRRARAFKESEEIRRAHEDRERSERRYRSLVEQTAEAVFCYEYEPSIHTDIPVPEQVKRLYEGRLAECNDVCARSYGAERADEVVGKRLVELFGTTPRSLDKLFTTFVETGYRTVDSEGVEVLPDGSKRYFLNNGHGVVEDGKLVRIWGTFREVTERRLAELALQESEKELRLVADGVPMHILHVGQDERFKFANAAASQWVGMRPADLVGRRLEDMMPSEVFRRALPHIRQAQAGKRVEFETEWEKKGRRHVLRSHLVPDTDEKGSVSGFYVLAEDVTERRRAKEKLERRLEFESLLAEMSRSLLASPAAAADKEVDAWARRLGEYVGVDRCQVWKASADQKLFRATHAWAGPGHASTGDALAESFPWSGGRLMRGETVCFSRLEELPPEAARDRAAFAEYGTVSILGIPMKVNGVFIAALTFATLKEERAWLPEVLQEMRLVGEVLASALARQQVEGKLQDALLEIRRLNAQLEAENVYLQEEIQKTQGFEDIIGESTALRSVLERVERVARTDATVLVLGESGTGKELIARAVHARSPRRGPPLVKVNCAALPSPLIESELFGHARGAFTGAMESRVGRFELADGGTIFLDEIGELAPELQAKLLQVLQEGKFEPLGSSGTTSVDVRVIAATNRDLRAALDEGRFREDLYFRLSAFPIQVPPLRERREDIPHLVRHFIRRKRGSLGRRVERVPAEVMDRLVSYDWPGNVRELENVVERACILSSGATLWLEETFAASGREVMPDPYPGDLNDVARRHILKVLEKCRWKIKGKGNAADRLGLHPSTLYYRMKKLGIERPSGPAA